MIMNSCRKYDRFLLFKNILLPCHLLETKSCPVCSILREEDYCDCHWQGICVYQEFLWENKKIKKRKSLVFDIVDKKYIRNNLITIKLKVNKPDILLSCNQPGIYAFLKITKAYEEVVKLLIRVK